MTTLLSRLVSTAALLAALGACSQDYSADTYSAGAVQQANKVDRGVVVGVRKIDLSADTTVGTVTGAAAGGAVGSQVPSGGVGAALGTVGGGLIGGIIGTTAQHTTSDSTAYEYIVRQPNGDLVSVTQQEIAPLQIGTHVLVITGKQARVVRDYTVNVETAPTAPAAKNSPTNAATITLPPPVSLAVPTITPLSSTDP